MKRWMYIPIVALLAFSVLDRSASLPTHALAVVNETALAPVQYRVLFPYLFSGLANAIGQTDAIWLFWFLAFGLFALLSDEWLNEWLSADLASLGTLLILILTISTFSFQPSGTAWMLLEALFWLIALLLIERGHRRWLIPLMFVATLNRETAIFLVPLVWLLTRDKRLAAALITVWGVTYGALRFNYGMLPPVLTMGEIWRLNTGSARFWHFLLALLLYGWLGILATIKYRHAPRHLRYAALATLPYIGAIAIFGVWREIRLFIPFLPIAVSLILSKGNRAELDRHGREGD